MTKQHRIAFHSRTACTAHDVIGCQDRGCRAAALGLSVAEYKARIVEPAAAVIAMLNRRDDAIRRSRTAG